MRTYTLRVNSSTKYGLGINSIIILEKALDQIGIEYDSAEGYIEHLEENLPASYEELNTVKSIEEDIVLIKRTESGVQEVIIPHTDEFNEICKKLIELSL
jgi:hypothetical protein